MEKNTSEVQRRHRFSGGPHGVGDPDDKSLRKVEVDILIPQIIRDKSRKEKCVLEVEEFRKCCKENNLTMIFKCRNENNKLKGCLERWFQDKDFQEECKQLYIEERTEFRKTNVPKNLKDTKEENSA